MLTLGIDEAGRGPVIGPLVIAGCLIDDKTGEYFKKIGVKDSKKLTRKKREELGEVIKEKAETFEIVIIFPNEIDGENYKGTNLNALEAVKSAEIINKINKGYKEIKVIIDCPSVNKEKWKNFLIKKLKNFANLEIVCEHKADSNYIAVSAASILAKNIREKEISCLKKMFGDGIGSGYCSDPLTCNFLLKSGHKHKDAGIFRKTWSTWRKAFEFAEQKKLEV